MIADNSILSLLNVWVCFCTLSSDVYMHIYLSSLLKNHHNFFIIVAFWDLVLLWYFSHLNIWSFWNLFWSWVWIQLYISLKGLANGLSTIFFSIILFCALFISPFWDIPNSVWSHEGYSPFCSQTHLSSKLPVVLKK